MARVVNKSPFLLGIASPEHKDQVFAVFGQEVNDPVGESFPTFVLMGTGLVGPHSEGCIEKENPLVGPPFQIPARRYQNP